MNDPTFMNDSAEWTLVDPDLNGDINLGLPLTDSLPQLNFEVLQSHLSNLSGPEIANRGPPERAPFGGKCDFGVEINSTHTHKKKYVFSHKLNRIYVDKDTDFSVEFNWRDCGDMFVRATCVFADISQAEKRVERCLQHYHQSSGSEPEVAKKNVLHSSRPAGTGGVEYCGDAGAADSWLSVRVRLQKPGAEPVTHAYRFVCKNSCTSGINRRAINIIFTLEDDSGVVHGRQYVGARVCACPRRDMLKDEEGEGVRGGKRRAPPLSSPPNPPAAKIKKEDTGDLSNNIIDLSMLHPRTALLGIDAMIKMQEFVNQVESSPRTRDGLTRLKATREDLKRKHPEIDHPV